MGHSRNWNAGYLIGQSLTKDEAIKKIGMVGIPTTYVAYELSKKLKVDMPIVVLSSEYEALLRYLERIDEISSQILIMKYEQGFSYKEIGERLNMTPSHVQTRIYRAKEKLKKLMREERSEETWIKNK